MNFRYIANQVGLLFLVLSTIMLLTAAIYLAFEQMLGHAIDHESQVALFASGAIGMLIGAGLAYGLRSQDRTMGRRDALLLVAASWVIGSALAALPYWLWGLWHFGPEQEHPFESFVDCYFEAVSGLTTTGSSVLTAIHEVPNNLLLWRAATQWLGGIGIVVLFVAVFPALGVGAKRMYTFETSGVSKEGVLPTIRATARTLLMIYVALTIVQTALLVIFGMNWFEAVCHAFATMATGGFSPRSASIGEYDSAAIEIIITLFMIAGGINFALYFHIIRGRFRAALADPELRLYLLLMVGVSLIITIIARDMPIVSTTGQQSDPGIVRRFLHALFNASSVQTTTGFVTVNYDVWPGLARALLFGLMIVGGSAGSTAGGFKVIRLIVAAKIVSRIIERAFRPQVVRPIRLRGGIVTEEVQLQTLGYLITALVALTAGSLIIAVLEPSESIDVTTAVTANVATFCTIGPGFGLVGPVANFGWMTAGSKLVLCAMMLLGRLEMVALIALFMPTFWKRT